MVCHLPSGRKKKKAVPNVKSTRNIKSCKVMLDLDRIRAGVPQSRGYGFVEFAHHLHALACLRELNNNATYCDMAGASGGMDDEEEGWKKEKRQT